MTLETSTTTSVSGVLTLAGFYTVPIPYTGAVQPPGSEAGSVVAGSGQSSQVEITFTLTYNYDGFLFEGSYLGGMVSIYDPGAEESYLYVIQGLASGVQA